MEYKFSFGTSMVLAAVATAAASLAIFSPSHGEQLSQLVVWGVVFGAIVVGAGGAMWLYEAERRAREAKFEQVGKKEERAERARLAAEVSEELAAKVERGELSADEARRRHRASQRGPDDAWVPEGGGA